MSDLVVALALILFFVPVSLTRILDGDEGYYTLAAELALQGRRLYVDFFYPQMPLLPYLYGVWMKIAGFSLEAARILSALCAALTGFLVYKYCSTQWGRKWGCFSAVLFAGGAFAFPWLVLVKTYALSTLLVFSAFFILAYPGFKSASRLFACGLALGLTVNTRLLFAGLVPIFLVYLFFSQRLRESGSSRGALFLYCLAGFLIGIGPAVLAFIAAPEHFIFNNIDYHLAASSASTERSFAQKAQILQIIFGFKNSAQDSGFQLPLLLWLSLGYLAVCLRSKKIPSLPFFLGMGLLALSLTPTPAYTRYFSSLAPFLALTVIELLNELARRQLIGFANRRAALLSLVVIALFANYLRLIPREIYRHCVSGENVLGVSSLCPLTPARLREIHEAVNRHSSPGDYVLSRWPGFIFATHARVVPRLENHFGFTAAKRLPAAERTRFRLPDQKYLISSIRSRQASLVLMQRGKLNERMNQVLEESGYQRLDRICTVVPYVRLGGEEGALGQERFYSAAGY